jgi:hypothetical protein
MSCRLAALFARLCDSQLRRMGRLADFAAGLGRSPGRYLCLESSPRQAERHTRLDILAARKWSTAASRAAGSVTLPSSTPRSAKNCPSVAALTIWMGAKTRSMLTASNAPCSKYPMRSAARSKPVRERAPKSVGHGAQFLPVRRYRLDRLHVVKTGRLDSAGDPAIDQRRRQLPDVS